MTVIKNASKYVEFIKKNPFLKQNMDEGENKCNNIFKDLHFKAVNTRSEVMTDDKKELLRRPKFVVVPAQLPTSASQCDTDNTLAPEKRLSSCATSPASIGLPAVVTPTKPSNYMLIIASYT